ncbi:MAG: hypothetical protein LBS89_01495, partial [Zoogloeaceae bacterium]|nr:hypothetical protein [Zoogloeaceae bacterium]
MEWIFLAAALAFWFLVFPIVLAVKLGGLRNKHWQLQQQVESLTRRLTETEQKLAAGVPHAQTAPDKTPDRNLAAATPQAESAAGVAPPEFAESAESVAPPPAAPLPPAMPAAAPAAAEVLRLDPLPPSETAPPELSLEALAATVSAMYGTPAAASPAPEPAAETHSLENSAQVPPVRAELVEALVFTGNALRQAQGERPCAEFPLERAFVAAKNWLFGGNTVLRVGVVLLFIGLAFLLRYASEQITIP